MTEEYKYFYKIENGSVKNWRPGAAQDLTYYIQATLLLAKQGILDELKSHEYWSTDCPFGNLPFISVRPNRNPYSECYLVSAIRLPHLEKNAIEKNVN